ncbi:MAG: hypothetical protein RLZZ50_1185 [Verrucomicrobiota bacterium]
MSPAYYLVEDGQTTGPHSLAVLRQKAEIHVLRPEALVHPADSTPDAGWHPISSEPELLALLFPARTAPVLGKASFDSSISARDASIVPFDVAAALRDNTARQVSAEAQIPLRPLVKIGGRRRRDFWIVVLTGNGAATAYVVLIAGIGPLQLAFLYAAYAFLTVAAYWVIFHIMERY